MADNSRCTSSVVIGWKDERRAEVGPVSERAPTCWL